MYKIFLALLVLTGSLTFVPAQEKPVNPNSNGQTAYSESMSYEPRKFEENNAKKKKEKQSKSESDEKNKAPESAAVQKAAADTGIKIPVFVYDAKGIPVNDLKDSDFKLFVDGNEQGILAFEKADQPLDLVLIVDMSPSTAYKPKDIKTFVTTLAESLKPQDKIQIISFNQELKILCEPTSDKQLINKAIKKLEMGDGTSIYEAVETIFQKIINSGDGQKSIVILSDGVDTTSRKANYLTSLLSAEKASAPVFVFYLDTFNFIPTFRPNSAPLLGILGTGRGVGSSKEEYELGLTYLQDIALLSGGRSLQVKNLTEVKTDEIAGILDFLKPRYFISFKLAENVNPAERKQLKVRVNRPNVTVRARGSYLAQ